MTNDINAMFISAIGKGQNNKSYKAVFDIGNDQIGITAAYSKEILPYVIEDMKKQHPHAKLIKITEA